MIEALLGRLEAAKDSLEKIERKYPDGLTGNSATDFNAGIDKAIEIIRQHEAQPPADKRGQFYCPKCGKLVLMLQETKGCDECLNSNSTLIDSIKGKLDKAMEVFKGSASHPAFDFVEDAHEDILIYLSEPARCEITVDDKHEKEMLEVIDERDEAQEALSQAYYLITGRSPEWSNLFGYDQALEEIDDAQQTLRQAIQKRESSAENAKKLQSNAEITDDVRLALEQSLDRMKETLEWYEKYHRIPAMDAAIALVEKVLKEASEWKSIDQKELAEILIKERLTDGHDASDHAFELLRLFHITKIEDGSHDI